MWSLTSVSFQMIRTRRRCHQINQWNQVCWTNIHRHSLPLHEVFIHLDGRRLDETQQLQIILIFLCLFLIVAVLIAIVFVWWSYRRRKSYSLRCVDLTTSWTETGQCWFSLISAHEEQLLRQTGLNQTILTVSKTKVSCPHLSRCRRIWLRQLPPTRSVQWIWGSFQRSRRSWSRCEWEGDRETDTAEQKIEMSSVQL